MRKNKRQRRPTEAELDELQIEEYIATNRHGPGDHRISAAEFILHLFDNPKE